MSGVITDRIAARSRQESGIPVRLPASIGSDLELVTACNLCGASSFEDVYPSTWVCRCRACGHVFRSPRPGADSIARFYSQEGKYAKWLDKLEDRARCWRYRLTQLRRFVKSGRLLDVGAGIGEFMLNAGRYFDVSGTEVSDEARRLAKQHWGVDLLKGTLAELPHLDAEPFDVVSLVHVLEHVHDPADTIARCERLLRPGGWLLVAVPNDSPVGWFKRYWGTSRLLQRLARTSRAIDYRETPPFGPVHLTAAPAGSEIHLSHFSVATLRRLLGERGFDVAHLGPDPYLATGGFGGARDRLDLQAWRLFAAAGGGLWYETILAVARKGGTGRQAGS
jgi:SAM-dependent methyltransferase